MTVPTSAVFIIAAVDANENQFRNNLLSVADIVLILQQNVMAAKAATATAAATVVTVATATIVTSVVVVVVVVTAVAETLLCCPLLSLTAAISAIIGCCRNVFCKHQ